MAIADDLKKEMVKQGLKPADLVRLSGVKQGRLSQILNGKTPNPRGDTISKLWAALGRSDDIQGGCVTVDIYNMVEGGPGAEPEWHEPIAQRIIPAELLKPNIRTVLVRGRSMEPTFRDGAIIGIDQNDKQVIDGEAYAVLLPYSGAAVKRLYPLPDGVLLRSDNKEFPEVKLTRADIPDHFILGRVRWVIQEM